MKNKYKILPLPTFYNFDEEDLENLPNNYPDIAKDEIKPVFGRDGLYYSRETKESWAEREGRAWSYKPSMFLHKLKMFDHSPLPNRVVEAIKTLQAYNVCPKELRCLLQTNEHTLLVRDVGKRAAKFSLQFRD